MNQEFNANSVSSSPDFQQTSFVSSSVSSSAQTQNDTGADENTHEIDLMELLAALRQYVLWIVAAALVGAILSWGYTHFLCKPQYKSEAVVYLVSASSSVLNITDLQLSNGITDDYTELIMSRSVLLTIADNLDLNYSYQQMKNIVSVSNPTNTHVLHISATCGDPDLAKSIANEAAYVSNRKISEIMEIQQPNIIDEAVVPSSPSSPNMSRNLLIGFLLGALAVVAVVVLRVVFDRTVKTPDDIERYCGLVTLTRVYNMNASHRGYNKKYYSHTHYGYGQNHPNSASGKTTHPVKNHKEK